jgi:Arc/MetJ-type ribon-helix-helix transcriptional regulator
MTTTWYDSGMTTKIAVSLPDDVVDDARAAVEKGDAASVSAYVAAAMRSFARKDSLATFLDDIDAELGPPSEEDLTWARIALRVDRS